MFVCVCALMDVKFGNPIPEDMHLKLAQSQILKCCILKNDSHIDLLPYEVKYLHC